ncbi:hypothetical protein JXK06_02535, partial [Patescibacteria group bacterium]|nr:hypothetical protein [Patescibacteria group bacterium]
DVSLEEGAKRIFLSLKAKNERNEASGLKSLEDVKASVVKRLESDRKRYKQYYNIDVNDFSHYDYYLDTTKMTNKEVAQAVFAFVSERLDKAKK